MAESLENTSELQNWLKEQNINSNKLHRDFSDASAVALLLKKFHPKLVDLNNYPPCSNTQLKLTNWETLNHKVLVKLGLHQNKNTLEKLSKSQPGVIDTLLLDIMIIQRSTSKSAEELWTESEAVMTVIVRKKLNNVVVLVPQKMILYSLYEKMLYESYLKDSYIYESRRKIKTLMEDMRHKDDQIDDLYEQMQLLFEEEKKLRQKLRNLKLK